MFVGAIIRVALLSALYLVSTALATPASAQSALSTDAAALAPEFGRFFAVWSQQWKLSQGDHHHTGPYHTPGALVRTPLSDGRISFRINRNWNGMDTNHVLASKPVRREATVGCLMWDLYGRWTEYQEQTRRGSNRLWIAGAQIESASNRFSVCPSWYLGPETEPPYDERVRFDDAISPHRRDVVKRGRAQLIDSLIATWSRLPGDRWLVGQTIRMLVDQEAFGRADSVITNCSSARWWCALLAGYVSAAQRNTIAAEADFRVALAEMPPTMRCSFLSVSALYLPEEAPASAKGCELDDSLAQRAWWLADPLWSAPGNERFVEHLNRLVLLELRTALSRDERFDWGDTVGGDARRAMVLRYGWPAFHFWRGEYEDSVMVFRKSDLPQPIPQSPPYVSYEYGAPRMHMLPDASTLSDPFSASSTAWQLNATPGGDTLVHFDPSVARYTRLGVTPEGREQYRLHNQERDIYMRKHLPHWMRTTLWWPYEHYASHRPLRQLPDPQVATLRRDSMILLAVSQPLDSGTHRAAGAAINAVTLLRSRGPDDVRIVSSTDANSGSHATLFGLIPDVPTMVGVEYAANDSGPDLRTRFGLRPSPALHHLVPGTFDLSAPVLLQLASASTPLPMSDTDALMRMAPRATVSRNQPIAIYWETYGVPVDDTAHLAVTVRRTDAPRGVGRLLNIRRSFEGEIAMKWTETVAAAHARFRIEGSVPIVGRSLRVNTTQLPAGDYVVDVSVRTQDGRTATSSKSITVRN